LLPDKHLAKGNTVAKQREIMVTVDAPASGYRFHIYANRFSIQKIDSYLLIFFGLINNRMPLAEVGCVMAIEDLHRNRSLNLQYLDQLKEQGEKADEYLPWAPTFNRADISVVNILSMTRSGGVAETLLLNISNRHVWEKMQGFSGSKLSVDPEALALIRSTVGFQMSLTYEMYQLVPNK
jgi:hypothetical protein